MPRDGSLPEMSPEERALRHADEFFTGPEKWHRGEAAHDPKGTGAICVGLAIINGAKHYDPNSGGQYDYFFADDALGRENDVWVSYWNTEDFIVISGNTAGEIQEKAEAELAKRGGKNPWSEKIK